MATSEEYGKKERLKAVTAVYLILMQGMDEVLLMLRQNTGYQDGSWGLPAGHLEGDELPKVALIREAKEEIGIDITEEDLELVHTSFRPAHDLTGPRIDLYFLANRQSTEQTPKNGEPEKCAELAWFPIGDLPVNTMPHEEHALACFDSGGAGEAYSELDLDWLKARDLYKL